MVSVAPFPPENIGNFEVLSSKKHNPFVAAVGRGRQGLDNYQPLERGL